MDTSKISILTDCFNSIVHEKENIEFWLARDLQKCLGYKTWENFETTIYRAMDSLKSTGVPIEDHFREVTKMVPLGSGARRAITDYMLTRYACYLIAQNGDPKKEEIAFSYVTKVTTGDGILTAYCYETKPDVDLNIMIEVI